MRMRFTHNLKADIGSVPGIKSLVYIWKRGYVHTLNVEQTEDNAVKRTQNQWANADKYVLKFSFKLLSASWAYIKEEKVGDQIVNTAIINSSVELRVL